jgi:hypothetical protein
VDGDGGGRGSGGGFFFEKATAPPPAKFLLLAFFFFPLHVLSCFTLETTGFIFGRVPKFFFRL